jgi:hypothetical protein
MAGRLRLHSEVDNGNVPAGLHGGDDDGAISPPPRDRGSQFTMAVYRRRSRRRRAWYSFPMPPQRTDQLRRQGQRR